MLKNCSFNAYDIQDSRDYKFYARLPGPISSDDIYDLKKIVDHIVLPYEKSVVLYYVYTSYIRNIRVWSYIRIRLRSENRPNAAKTEMRAGDGHDQS